MTAAAPSATELTAPFQCIVAEAKARVGDTVAADDVLMFVEAMKMQHPVTAITGGQVTWVAAVGDVLNEGDVLVRLAVVAGDAAAPTAADTPDATVEEARVPALEARLAKTLDAARPAAVAKRHAQGGRTARENIADLCDDDSLVEIGQLAVAAQRRRRDLDDLIDSTPADGLVAGIATINRDRFADNASAAVLAYDYTVLAGTQGFFNHRKVDRLLDHAGRNKLPVVFYTEGGGGRPGDVDIMDISASWLEVPSFARFAALSGQVPRISIAHGRCFAGNAAFFGSADVTIATRSAWIGMAGPAMIEGGGLGRVAPEEIGPAAQQADNGVVDLLADDEAHATQLAREVLSMAQGACESRGCADQQALRSAVPENRKQVYDMRALITALADTDSVIELRRDYGPGMITALVRLDGEPFGVIANDPAVLGGAIDATGGEKAARFMQLCDAWSLPLLSLCDTPGFMVGPEHESQAAVRRVCRMFVHGAAMRMPIFLVVVRKAYGLGAQAMAGGSLHEPALSLAWSSGELGPMGLEGAVRLGYRRELAAAGSEAEREALFEKLLASLYEKGKAENVAATVELDAVIDPADTRRQVLSVWAASRHLKDTPRRPIVDTW